MEIIQQGLTLRSSYNKKYSKNDDFIIYINNWITNKLVCLIRMQKCV